MSELATTDEDTERNTSDESVAGGPVADGALAKLLETYGAINDEINRLSRERRTLRPLVDSLPVGTFGDWQKTYGTPGEIDDKDEIERIFAEELGRPVPKTEGKAPLQITFVGRRAK